MTNYESLKNDLDRLNNYKKRKEVYDSLNINQLQELENMYKKEHEPFLEIFTNLYSNQIIPIRIEIDKLEHKLNKFHHYFWRKKNPNALEKLKTLKNKEYNLLKEFKPNEEIRIPIVQKINELKMTINNKLFYSKQFGHASASTQ